MTTSSTRPAKTGLSRVFLIEGRAGPTHQPAYQAQMKAGAPARGYGSTSKIEAPSQTARDEYEEIGEIRGANERPTISLMGRYALDIKSAMLKMAENGCPFDVQVVFGACTDPRDPNKYTKKMLFENAIPSNWSADELGSLSSDERAPINETLDVSSRTMYEVVEMSFASRGGDVVTNEVVDITVCDAASCGECEDESSGCDKIYGISLSAGGSPSTPPDIIFSLDKGATWGAHDIDSLGAAEDADGVACITSYVVVVSQDSESLHYVEKDEITVANDPDWTEVTTGFVTGGGPRTIVSTGTRAFIAGAGGYIYTTTDPTGGVTVVDAGVNFPLGSFNDIDALNEDFAVAVGDGGAIAKTENTTTWTAVTPPVGVGVNLNAIALKSEKQWWVGTNSGRLYYTLDGGASWTEKTFTGSGSGSVEDIDFASESVLYVSHTTAATRGRILKSTDGGYSFVVLPEGSATMPLADKFNALAICEKDVDFVVGAGLNDNGSDGIIVVGSG